jgi:hypothetical protein
MPRSWPYPPARFPTLHLIGDVHAAVSGLPVYPHTQRRDKVAADVLQIPQPLARVQVGDITNDGTAAQDALAIAFMNSLGGQWYTALGNHDIEQNARTAAAWATAYGLASKNYTADLGFAKLIFVGPDAIGANMTLAAATLTFLTDELANAGKDCFVISHAPLYNTVVGSTTGPGAVWSSTEAFFYIYPDADIRAILNAQPNAKAFISGHTHSTIDTPGFIKSESVGTRNIICINCSATFYTGRTFEWYDPLITLFLPHTGSNLEIRFRNHGAGIWDAIGVSRVVTMPIPA